MWKSRNVWLRIYWHWGILEWCQLNDDVIKWKHFPRYCPLCGEFTGPSEFPIQWLVTRSFGVFFDLGLNKRLSKQLWGWWFETPPWSLRRQCNVNARQAKPAVHLMTPLATLLYRRVYVSYSHMRAGYVRVCVTLFDWMYVCVIYSRKIVQHSYKAWVT